MYIDIQKITNININDEIKTIIKLNNYIDDYCYIETQNTYSPNANVFERIKAATDILVLNAIRYNKNQSYTIEIDYANIANIEILDILYFIVKELVELKNPQELLDNILEYMPSPVDIPAIKGVNPDTEAEEERKASDRT